MVELLKCMIYGYTYKHILKSKTGTVCNHTFNILHANHAAPPLHRHWCARVTNLRPLWALKFGLGLRSCLLCWANCTRYASRGFPEVALLHITQFMTGTAIIYSANCNTYPHYTSRKARQCTPFDITPQVVTCTLTAHSTLCNTCFGFTYPQTVTCTLTARPASCDRSPSFLFLLLDKMLNACSAVLCVSSLLSAYLTTLLDDITFSSFFP